MLFVSVLQCAGAETLGFGVASFGTLKASFSGFLSVLGTLIGACLILVFCVPVTITAGGASVAISLEIRASFSTCFFLLLPELDLFPSFLECRTGAGGGRLISCFSSFYYNNEKLILEHISVRFRQSVELAPSFASYVI